MAKDTKLLKNKDDERKVYAFIAVLLSIIGFIIVLLVKKDDKYVMFYAKESLIIFISMLIVGGVNMIMDFIPFIGKIIQFILVAFVVIVWIITLIYSLSGKEKETFIIGDFARKINL